MKSQRMTIIFDFDGTVADSFKIAVDIGQKALEHYGYPVPTKEELRALRELSASQIIRKAKISPRHLPGMARFVRRAQKDLIGQVEPIPGMPEVLARLSKKHNLAILSSSDAPLIQGFLAKHHLKPYVSEIVGGVGIFMKHRALVRYMREHGLGQAQVVYVGDEARDIDAGHRASVKVVSVTWGFNGRGILSAKNPGMTIAKPAELDGIIEQLQVE